MPRRKTPEAVLKDGIVLLLANTMVGKRKVVCGQKSIHQNWVWLASSNQIRPRFPNCILERAFKILTVSMFPQSLNLMPAIPVITKEAPTARRSPSIPQFNSHSLALKVYFFLPLPVCENMPSMTSV
jgi:hypothetical protein